MTIRYPVSRTQAFAVDEGHPVERSAAAEEGDAGGAWQPLTQRANLSRATLLEALAPLAAAP